MEAPSSSDKTGEREQMEPAALTHPTSQTAPASPTHSARQPVPASQTAPTPTSSHFSKLRNPAATAATAATVATSSAASPSRLRNTIAALALGPVAAAIGSATAACSSLPEAEMQARHDRETANLTKQLERCGELKDFPEGIISMGTLGLRRLYHDRENRIRLNKGVSKVDQVFFPWPMPHSPEAITIEGDPAKLSGVNFGSYFGVQFRAENAGGMEKKDSFVIQNSMVGALSEADPGTPGIHRYVVIIEWR